MSAKPEFQKRKKLKEQFVNIKYELIPSMLKVDPKYFRMKKVFRWKEIWSKQGFTYE